MVLLFIIYTILTFLFIRWILKRYKANNSAQAPTTSPVLPDPQAPPAPPEPTVLPDQSVPPHKRETHKVAGVSFRQDSIKALAVENPDYCKTKRELIDDYLTDEWIYEYDFYPGNVELVPEPDNPTDPKAIKVVAKGQHIGYIKSGSCAHIHKLLNSGTILDISCEISGGRRKILHEDENEDGKAVYNLDKDEIPFYASISIIVAL